MKSIFTYFFLFITLFASAQNTYQAAVTAGINNLSFEHVTQLNDGSFIGEGITTGSNNSIYIARLDASGAFLSGKLFTGTGGLMLYTALTGTSDGGFAISGFVGTTTIVLLKFSADITLQWSKQYNTATTFNNNSRLTQTADGYMLSLGIFKGNGYYGPDGALLKTDNTGSVVFLKKYFTSTFSYFYDIKTTPDNNLVFLSRIDSFKFAPATSYSCVTKIKPDGSVLWSTAIRTATASTAGSSLFVSANGDILVGGTVAKRLYVDDGEEGEYVNRDHMLITKYNSSGQLLWSKHMEFADNADHETVYTTADSKGNYLLFGYVKQYTNDYVSKMYSFVTNWDTSGRWQWTKKRGGDNGLSFTASMAPTADSGYIGGGSGTYNNAKSFFFSKYNNNSETCGTTTTDSAEAIDTMGVTITQPTIVTNIAATASDFTLTQSSVGAGTILCNGVLPVKLLSFTARPYNKKVAIAWKTSNETNEEGYTVERSSNGTSFTPVLYADARGNGGSTQAYAVTDASPLPGTSYYRLQQRDKSGAVTYSQIIPVVFSNAGVFIVSPNPVATTLHILMQSKTAGKATLQVTDMAGKQLLTQSVTVVEGINSYSIPAFWLTKGVYMVKMIGNNTLQSTRIIKE